MTATTPPTVQPDPLSGTTGLLPDIARAALQALDDGGTGTLWLEVSPAASPGAWASIGTGAPCTWTLRSGVFDADLTDGRTGLEVPAPDYPCTGTRWAVYRDDGALLLATAPGEPCMRGDVIRWTGAR